MADPGFAKVVDGGPDEVAEDVTVGLDGVPVLVCLVGEGFGAGHDAIRVLRVVLLVLGPLVVVAAHVEVREGGLHVGPGLAGMVPCVADGGGDFASGVELVGESGEGFADLDAVGLGALIDFIADAPEDDARDGCGRAGSCFRDRAATSL